MTNVIERRDCQKRIASLLVASEQCDFNAWIDTGECYALKRISKGFQRPQWFASDGTRWWRNPYLVLTIDIYNEELVTTRYSLRHVPTLPRTLVKVAGFEAVVPPALPDYLDIRETIVFDHMHPGESRRCPKKEVYLYGPTG